MKLRRRNKLMKDEYLCELTDRLDHLSNINKDGDSVIAHYLIIDTENDHIIYIRVPGGTIGNIEIVDGCISKITIYPVGTPVSYPGNVQKKISDFIGENIEFE